MLRPKALDVGAGARVSALVSSPVTSERKILRDYRTAAGPMRRGRAVSRGLSLHRVALKAYHCTWAGGFNFLVMCADRDRLGPTNFKRIVNSIRRWSEVLILCFGLKTERVYRGIKYQSLPPLNGSPRGTYENQKAIVNGVTTREQHSFCPTFGFMPETRRLIRGRPPVASKPASRPFWRRIGGMVAPPVECNPACAMAASMWAAPQASRWRRIGTVRF